MKIKVFGPMGLGKNLDDRGWLTLEEGATLGDAVKKIGVPPAIARVVKVALNGEVQSLKTVLKEGDVISFFSMIRGG